MYEWFKSTELIDIVGMPSSRQAIAKKASRNKWLKRKALGQGRSYEFHISNFHFDTQKYLYEKYATDDDKQRIGECFTDETYALYQEHGEKLYYWAQYDRSKHVASFPEKPIANDAEDIESKREKTFNHAEESNVSGQLEPLSNLSGWCEFPVFDVHAAAGAKSLINTEYQIDSLSLPKELIKNHGVDEKKSVIIFVDGSSMIPTLVDGDRALVDLRETQHPVKDGVYVIRIDEAVYIKRLRWDIARGVYNVISDNTDYEPFEINHNNDRNFNILGRVKSVVMKDVI